jgi:hypothetical protein
MADRAYYYCGSCDRRWSKIYKWLGLGSKGPGSYCPRCRSNCHPVGYDYDI